MYQTHPDPTVGTGPIAVGFGILLPTVLGAIYGDIIAGLIYPGLVARILGTFRRLFLED